MFSAARKRRAATRTPKKFVRAQNFWRTLSWPVLCSVCIVVPLAGVAGGGCGYQLLRPDAALPGVARVALSGFRNATLEAGASALLDDAFSRELLRHGALRLVSEPARANLQLDGVVRAINTQSRSLSPLSFALEYEVRLEISLRARRGDAELFAAPQVFAARERYLASSEPEVTRTNREEALRRLASTLATRAFDALHTQLTQHAQVGDAASPPSPPTQLDGAAPASPPPTTQPVPPPQFDDAAHTDEAVRP